MGLSDLNEATPDTPSEDIAAYAKAVVEEVAAERQGEPEKKSDAQITSEQAGIRQPSETRETTAEDKSGSNTASEGEDTGDDSGLPEWMTDDVKAEAAAYGFDESELADFASREELNRALKLFDKAALEAGRKALAEGEEETPNRNEKGQFVKKEEPKADQSKEETPMDGRYQVALDPEIYDESIINEFTRMRDHYESRLETLESYFAEASASAEEQRFDSFIDSLGHADLFGTTGKESPQELERRRDLNVAVKAQMIGLAKLGRPTEMTQQLIERVANMTFGEQLTKKRLKQQTSKISRQSQLRQGGSPTKPLPPRDDPREAADRLYRELAGS